MQADSVLELAEIYPTPRGHRRLIGILLIALIVSFALYKLIFPNDYIGILLSLGAMGWIGAVVFWLIAEFGNFYESERNDRRVVVNEWLAAYTKRQQAFFEQAGCFSEAISLELEMSPPPEMLTIRTVERALSGKRLLVNVDCDALGSTSIRFS